MFSIKRVEFWIQTCYSGIRGLKTVFWAKATQNLKIFWILINKRDTWKKKSGKKVGDSERLNIDKIFCNLKGYCRCERWGYIGVFWGAESENVTDF